MNKIKIITVVIIILLVGIFAPRLFNRPRPGDTIYVNGVHIATNAVGAGKPVILIHGLGYSKESMSQLAEHLKQNHLVISYDVRGHGQSDKPESFTLDDHADDLAAIIKTFKLQKPVIVGFSMGSYITLRAAEKYPDMFSKIVLIGTKGGGETSSSQQYQNSADTIMGRVFAPMTTPDAIAEFARSSASPVQLTNDQKNAIYKSLTEFDLMADIANVKMPALVMTGEYDGLNPPAAGKMVAESLPDAIFYVVPNAGHIAFFENPDFVYEHIDEFLAK